MKSFLQFIKEASDYLYHATFKAHHGSIIKNGLLSNPKTKNWADSEAGKVYLAKSPDVALSHIETANEAPDHLHNSGYVVYKIKKNFLNAEKLKADRNVHGSDDTLEYHGDIPAKHLSVHSDIKEEQEDYRGQHQAPGPKDGSPMHDVTKNGTYPKDFYSSNGFRYYSDAGSDLDRESHDMVTRFKDKPDEKVWIYRAVPKSIHKEAMKTENPTGHMIRKGDWVTINKAYAKEHGEANLNNDYHIAAKRVPASHIYTNGDSVHEWGYHPPKEIKEETDIKVPGVYNDGTHNYSVDRLIKAVGNRKPSKVPVDDVIQKNKDLGTKEGNFADNVAKPSDGFKARAMKADTSHPVLLDKDGYIVDGSHRVAKQKWSGASHIQAHHLTDDDFAKAKIDNDDELKKASTINH